jgi:hypothetical protein
MCSACARVRTLPTARHSRTPPRQWKRACGRRCRGQTLSVVPVSHCSSGVRNRRRSACTWRRTSAACRSCGFDDQLQRAAPAYRRVCLNPSSTTPRNPIAGCRSCGFDGRPRRAVPAYRHGCPNRTNPTTIQIACYRRSCGFDGLLQRVALACRRGYRIAYCLDSSSCSFLFKSFEDVLLSELLLKKCFLSVFGATIMRAGRLNRYRNIA